MIDIFFIDWERPKDGGGKMRADGKTVNSESSVSIWRTYFVANEWNEIQTIRKTNVFFQLMGTLFFLEVLRFKEYGRSDPTNDLFPSENYHDSPYNAFLRFSIGCSVYIGVGLLQVSILAVLGLLFALPKSCISRAYCHLGCIGFFTKMLCEEIQDFHGFLGQATQKYPRSW